MKENAGANFRGKLGGVGERLKRSATGLGQRVNARGVDSAEIFEGDSPLRKALDELEEVREHMNLVWNAVDTHGKDMMTMANSQRTMSQRLTSSASSIITTSEKHLAKERITAQVSLGAAEAQAAQTAQKFAQDMVDPLRDIQKRFDDKYRSTIVVLRRHYINQKRDYLNYNRKIQATDDENKKYDLESLRDASRPIWEKTSVSLKAEADKLAVEGIKDLNHYLVKLSLVRRHTVIKIADCFKDSFESAAKIRL